MTTDWSKIRRTAVRTAVFACACLSISILIACRTDYTADAVESAREYALKNLRGITASQREFVRFTQPEIYEDLVFPKYVTPLLETGHHKVEKMEHFPTAPGLDLMHSCVVWSPPGTNAKIVVVGDGERNMQFWKPYRVLIKEYLPADTAFRSACAVCARYARNGMLYLSEAERDRIRFSDPEEFCFTKLDIPELVESLDQELESEWEKYLQALKGDPLQISQISLIWPADEKDKRIVFSGYTRTGSLMGWQLITAELMKKGKLDAHRLTKEEIEEIEVLPVPERGLVFPVQLEVERTSGRTAPDSPQTGGSLILNR
ncbi:MAG: hypothetical protein J5944_14825 [Lentisphaeria bacterium]|nr:hypothetical protein [Lentisphaeria bacterium]